jgi:hypothetical protein
MAIRAVHSSTSAHGRSYHTSRFVRRIWASYEISKKAEPENYPRFIYLKASVVGTATDGRRYQSF